MAQARLDPCLYWGFAGILSKRSSKIRHFLYWCAAPHSSAVCCLVWGRIYAERFGLNCRQAPLSGSLTPRDRMVCWFALQLAASHTLTATLQREVVAATGRVRVLAEQRDQLSAALAAGDADREAERQAAAAAAAAAAATVAALEPRVEALTGQLEEAAAAAVKQLEQKDGDVAIAQQQRDAIAATLAATETRAAETAAKLAASEQTSSVSAQQAAKAANALAAERDRLLELLGAASDRVDGLEAEAEALRAGGAEAAAAAAAQLTALTAAAEATAARENELRERAERLAVLTSHPTTTPYSPAGGTRAHSVLTSHNTPVPTTPYSPAGGTTVEHTVY
jgi:hypothetical protein